MKLVSVVGARPQFVKLAPIDRVARASGVEHIIVHTGQHYDPMLSEVFFRDLGISAPHVHLDVGSGSHGAQTGAILSLLDDVLPEQHPDWVLVYGDTNSTVAAALSAVKLHLRVAHLEAGLRSFNRRMPEEHNRVLTDHAADLLLAPTEAAMHHLDREGLGERAILVGDVMTDVLMAIKSKVEEDREAEDHSIGFPPRGYYVATLHRAENTDDPVRLRTVVAGLAALDKPVVLLAHPRLLARAKEYEIDLNHGALQARSPLAYPALIRLVLSSAGVVTDSGGLQKEAFLLRIPCTTIRTETEWRETVELGWNVLANTPSEIRNAATRRFPAPTDATPYGDGRAAEQVIRELQTRS